MLERFPWSRHSNPRSVWALVGAFPVLIALLYRRDWPLLLATLAAVPLSLLAFRPPEDDRAWATRVVRGEHVWMQQGLVRSRESLLVLGSAPVYVLTIAAAVRRRARAALLGTLLSLALMLAFFQRMVRLHEGTASGANE